MKMLTTLTLTLMIAACSHGRADDTQPEAAGEVVKPIPPKPTCETPDETKLFRLEGTFAAGDRDLALLTLDGEGSRGQLWVRVPSTFARYFPEDSPYTPTQFAIGLDDCGRVAVSPSEAKELMSGARMRFDLAVVDGEPTEVKLVRVEGGGEQVLETLALKRLDEPTAQDRYDRIVKPVVTAYLDHFRNHEDKNAWISESAERGNAKDVAERLKSEKYAPEEYVEAMERAIRSGSLATVRTLWPFVEADARKDLHCSIEAGMSYGAYGVNGRMAMDIPTYVPKTLQNVDILNFLLGQGNQFGPCTGGEKRIHLIANVANATTLERLRTIPGIEREQEDGNSIFWLAFQNRNLKETNYDLARYLQLLNYFEVPENITIFWLTGPAQWLTAPQFQAIAEAINPHLDMLNQARASIERDRKDAQEGWQKGEDFQTRLYNYRAYKNYEGKTL